MWLTEFLSLAPVLAMVLALLTALMEAGIAVMVSHLETQIPSLQLFFFEELTIFTVAVLFAIVRSRSISIFQIANDIKAIFPPFDNNEIVIHEEEGSNTVKTHKYSALQLWSALIARAVMGSLTSMLQILSLRYISSGDSMALMMVTYALTAVIVGIICLKEKATIGIFFASMFCVVGIVLITHLSFIFDTNSSINGWGVLMASLAGFVWASASVMVRKMGDSLHWLAITLVLGFNGTIIASLALIFTHLIGIDSWVNLSNIIDMNRSIIYISFVGFFGFMAAFQTIVAYQLYDASRVSIMITTVVPITYLAQQLFLNETENWIVYLGMSFVAIGIIWIGLENIRKVDDDIHTVTSSADDSFVSLPIDDVSDDEKSFLL